jgi:DNA-binding CsgD family transcriptional regulator
MRKLSFDPEKFKELYAQGMNDREISSLLNCKDSSIQSYRKKNNIASNFTYQCKIDDRLEEIKLLKEQGLGNRKIAERLKIPRTSLMYLFRKHNLVNIKYIPKSANLNHFQYSALIGSLLGDSSISKKFTLNIGHGVKQEEYYKHKIELFSPNIKFLEYKIEKIDKRTNNTYTCLQAYSNRYEDIVSLRNVFYPENIKVISEDILSNFNEISLAYLFMDDGSYNKSGATIALCNFSNENLMMFKDFLLKKWDIEITIHKTKCIYIKANSRKIFINLIKPYIIPSMLYKLQSPQ